MRALTAAFQFAEGLIVPQLATDAPTFAVGWPSGRLRHWYSRSCCRMRSSDWRRFQWE
jgi:hypothetical protein